MGVVKLLFEALVDDALVSGVHVHHDQALAVFGQDVDTVQLGDGAAQRPVALGQVLWGSARIGRSPPRLHRLLRRQHAGLSNGCPRRGLHVSRPQCHGVGLSRPAGPHGAKVAGTASWRQVQAALLPTRLTRQGQLVRGLLVKGRLQTACAHGGLAALARRCERLCGARCRQRVFDRMQDRLMHFTAVAKAHFDFGGVHVDIDPGWIDLHVQHVDGLLVPMQHVLKAAARRMGDHLVAHIAAIDVRKLLVAARARQVGQADAAPDAHRASIALVVDGQRLLGKLRAEHIGQALRQRVARLRSPLLEELALVPNRKTDVRPCQSMAAHGLHAMGQFCGISLEKFAPCGRGEKQLAHLYRGANGAGRRLELAGAGIELPGVGRIGGAREHAHVGDGGNGGQRFTAKTHGGNRFEVLQRPDLAGRMALERHGQLGRRNAQPVVFDPDHAHAGCRQAHHNIGGPCIKRVVEQLTHHRRGPLDHLTGGNLTDQLVRQFADRTGRYGR